MKYHILCCDSFSVGLLPKLSLRFNSKPVTALIDSMFGFAEIQSASQTFEETKDCNLFAILNILLGVMDFAQEKMSSNLLSANRTICMSGWRTLTTIKFQLTQ